MAHSRSSASDGSDDLVEGGMTDEGSENSDSVEAADESGNSVGSSDESTIPEVSLPMRSPELALGVPKIIDTIRSCASRSVIDRARLKCLRPPYEIRRPEKHERVHRPPPNEIGIYLSCMACGLRFPLHPFLVLILQAYDVAICQLTPNSFCSIMGFIILCSMVGVELTLPLFRSFFSIKKTGSYHVFGGKRNKPLLTDMPNKHPSWAKKFVFIRMPEGHGLRRSWGIPRNSLNLNVHLSEEEERSVQILNGLDDELRSIPWLTSGKMIKEWAWKEGGMAGGAAVMSEEEMLRMSGEATGVGESSKGHSSKRKKKAAQRDDEPKRPKKTVVAKTGSSAIPVDVGMASRDSGADTEPPHPSETAAPKKTVEHRPDPKVSRVVEPRILRAEHQSAAPTTEPVSTGLAGNVDRWPFGTRSIWGKPAHEECELKLARFKKTREQVLQIAAEKRFRGQSRYPVDEDESVFDDAGVAARLADNSVLPKDRASLLNVDPERLSATASSLCQQLNTVLVALQPHAQVANDAERVIAKRSAEARDLKQKLITEEEVSAGLRRQLEERDVECASLRQEKSELALLVAEDKEEIAKLRADRSAALKVAEEATARADRLERVDHQKLKDEGVAEYQRKVLLDLMGKARKDSFDKGFDKGYLLGIQRCKRQVVRDFPDARLDLSDWVVKSDDEEDEEEEEGEGEGDDVQVVDEGQNPGGDGGQGSGSGRQAA